MSDLPQLIAKGDSVAHFGFSPKHDTSLEISLWEILPGVDSLSQTVLFLEDLMTKDRPRVDVLVNVNETQVDVKSILAGKMMMISPVKSQNGRIRPFLFRSKPGVEGKSVPIALLIDSDRDFAEKDLMDILTSQELRLIPAKKLQALQKKAGRVMILTYYQRRLP
jgi:hypothetical protein